MQAVLGKHHQVHYRGLSAGFPDQVTHTFSLGLQLFRRCHVWQLQLNQSDHHPIRGLVQTT
jgi:hypothetical protein